MKIKVLQQNNTTPHHTHIMTLSKHLGILEFDKGKDPRLFLPKYRVHQSTRGTISLRLRNTCTFVRQIRCSQKHEAGRCAQQAVNRVQNGNDQTTLG